MMVGAEEGGVEETEGEEVEGGTVGITGVQVEELGEDIAIAAGLDPMAGVQVVAGKGMVAAMIITEEEGVATIAMMIVAAGDGGVGGTIPGEGVIAAPRGGVTASTVGDDPGPALGAPQRQDPTAIAAVAHRPGEDHGTGTRIGIAAAGARQVAEEVLRMIAAMAAVDGVGEEGVAAPRRMITVVAVVEGGEDATAVQIGTIVGIGTAGTVLDMGGISTDFACAYIK